MGNHRRPRPGLGLRAGVLALVLMVGAGVAVLWAASRGEPPTAQLAARPDAAPASVDGSWTGPLADPDTATHDVVLTVAGPGRGVTLDVPALSCSYRGADPRPVPGAGVTADLAETADPRGQCADTARVRVAPDGTGRVRYDLLETCDAAVCTPRRASGVLAAP